MPALDWQASMVSHTDTRGTTGERLGYAANIMRFGLLLLSCRGEGL